MHVIVFLMSFNVKKNFESLRILALIVAILIWTSNSVFTFLSALFKIIEIIQKKLRLRKVEPQEINDKDLVISNIET